MINMLRQFEMTVEEFVQQRNEFLEVYDEVTYEEVLDMISKRCLMKEHVELTTAFGFSEKIWIREEREFVIEMIDVMIRAKERQGQKMAAV
ncbi:hypothetical protein [Priestia megaterium]|uniref:hypothetical protein n=1 Tax=Priestia megaterium TaxID=1404 RepID=UPI000BFD808A|nr:hypothetical protein [Priestia megaterium]PGQ88209.1 hypothetical protein COA18_04595 [Priestia megaterium]